MTPVVFVRGAVLPPELCAVLADRLDDPGWRASLAIDDAAAVAARIPTETEAASFGDQRYKGG